jgi:hypothetical protein
MDIGYTNIAAHDPIAVQNFKQYYDFPIEYHENLDTMNADVLVITTAWEQYKGLSGKIVDCRYCLHEPKRGDKP